MPANDAQVPAFQTGNVLSHDRMNGIADPLNLLLRESGHGKRQSGDGRRQTPVTVKIISQSTEAGKYNCKIFKLDSLDPAVTGDLEESDLGTLPDDPNAIAWCLADVGTGTWSLDDDSYQDGHAIGPDANGKMVVRVGASANGSGPIPVRLVADGGSTGDSTHAISITYTVTKRDDHTFIYGTLMTPKWRPFPFGTITPAAEGWYLAVDPGTGDPSLEIAYEVYDSTAACITP